MKADIVAFKSNTLLSRLIRKFTGEDITHVALMVDDGLIMETSLFGVRMRLLNHKEYPHRIYRCESLIPKQRDDIVAFVQYCVGIGYDFKLLLGMGFNIIFGKNLNWNDTSRYMCIELIADAFESVSVNLFPFREWSKKLYPSDVEISSHLTMIKQVGEF